MRVKCPVCKNYDISDEAISLLSECHDEKKTLLSAIVRRHFDFKGHPETITTDNWQALASQAPDKNDVPSKVRYLLGYIAKKSRFPSDRIALNGKTDYPICFAANTKEFEFYIRYATEAGFLDLTIVCGDTTDVWQYWLTAKGWEETRRIPTLDSPYAFVAMAFAKEGDLEALLTNAFEHAIQPAIEKDAGYEKAIRIDKEEFLGDVVFEIIARIKECRFVVADVTDHRNGVYFEGGYAMGMDMKVIWTCHKDHIKTAHFDTNHLNHIVWDDVGEFRKSLANRILATIGRDPKKKGNPS